jgi:hypothetical protein
MKSRQPVISEALLPDTHATVYASCTVLEDPGKPGHPRDFVDPMAVYSLRNTPTNAVYATWAGKGATLQSQQPRPNGRGTGW